jgi:hypothetical protein
METKDGIKITSKGLFLPTKFFRRMTERLEIIVSAGEIVIRSSVKNTAMGKRRRKRGKGQRAKTPAVL